MKKFNGSYESYIKGKKNQDNKDIQMSKDDNEPPIGGYT